MQKKKADGKLTRSKGVGETEIQNGRFQKEKDINAVDYNAARDATKSFQVKRHDRKARLLRRLKVPFTYHAKTRRGGAEKKDADAICKTPVGEERAMVIEEVEEEERRWQKSKSREGKFRYCLRQPRGTQRL